MQGATARHMTTRTLLFHRVAGAPLEQIHSGRIRLLLPSNAVVFTGTSGRIVGYSETTFWLVGYSSRISPLMLLVP